MTARDKQTEVGKIPEDWDVGKLAELLEKRPEYGINAPAVRYEDDLPVYIRITDISEEGAFAPETKVSVNKTGSHQYYLEEGDLVFARTGASVGKSYLYDPIDGDLVFAGFLIRIRPDKEKLHPNYLAQYVRTQTYWNWVQTVSMRSGQPGINGYEYGQLKLPLPPVKEQKRIAKVLDDVDELIATLDKLIAKKRAVKTAVMQQLLTGKTRLPGFDKGKAYKQTEIGLIPRDWEVRHLGTFGSFKKGRNIPKKQLTSRGKPCVLYGEIYTRYDAIVEELSSFIPEKIAKNATPIHYGDILFAGSGETAEEIGKCFAYLGEETAYAGGDIIVLTLTGGDSSFLGYLLNAPLITKQKATIGQGSSVIHIYASGLATIKIPVPSPEEQKAIATILSDIDDEITAIEKRRDKTKAIKQGMMQELLTGRTRLI